MAKFMEFDVNARILSFNISRFPNRLNSNLKAGINLATKKTSEAIKKDFRGAPLGFKDQTGGLRESIKGGFVKMTMDGPVGVVRAGDSKPNKDGIPTRDYVGKIEFGVFQHAGHTAFLRPGVLSNLRLMTKIILDKVRRLKI